MSVRDMVVEFNEKGFKQLQDKVNKIDKNLAKKKEVKVSTKKATFDLKKLGGVFNKFALGVTGAITGVLYGLNKFIDKVDNIVNKVQVMGGISTDMFQTLSAMGKEAGFTMEDVETAMQKLNKTSAKRGDTRDADTRLKSMFDELASIEDPALRSAKAMEVFGRSGNRLMPIILKGSKGLAEYKKAMGGALISEKDIKRTMILKEEMDKFNLALESVKNNFFLSFLDDTVDGTIELKNTMKEFSELDFKPLTSIIVKIVNWSVDFLSNIVKGINLWRENQDIKKYNAEEKARYERPVIGDGILDKGFALINKDIQEYMATDQSRLNIAIEKMNKDLDVDLGDKLTKELQRIAVSGLPRQRDEAVEILRKIEQRDNVKLVPTTEEQKKVTDTTTPTTKTPSVGNTSGGRTSSGIGGGVETISVLMHFKNEFTVFAHKLLKLQERGTTYGGQQIRDNRAISLSVNVTANNKSGKELGDEVAKSISKSLKDILNTNTSIIQAIKQHEDTVKEITKDDGKTASIRPSSEPVPNPMA